MAPKDTTLGSTTGNLAIFAQLGLYSPVAGRLGVDRSHVRRVAIGQRQSRRIMRAIAKEIVRIKEELANSRVLSGTSGARGVRAPG